MTLSLSSVTLQIIQKPSHDLKQQLAVYSKRVAGSVTELIQAAEAMKGIATCDLSDRENTGSASSRPPLYTVCVC